MDWYQFIFLFIQGFILASILTQVFRAIAPKIGFLDQPGERKVHHNPKPLLGGAAIYFAFIIILFINLLILRYVYNNPLTSPNWFAQQLNVSAIYASGIRRVFTELMGLLAGGTLLFVVGLIDDKYGMNPLIKLIAQVFAALILYWCDIQIALFIKFPLINFVITLFWIVLLTNSFNLLDNMDGLSGGVAMIALILLGIATDIVSQQVFMTSISILLAGCIAGFLRYNLSPSSIFMGDAGSLFLGFMVSALTIMSTFYETGDNATSWSVVMPFVILAVPLFDTVSVIFIRIKNGKPIYLGDKNHFSHRLVALGMSHRRAVFFIHLLTLAVGSSALILPFIEQSLGAYIILSQMVIFFVLITMLEAIKKNGGKSQGDT